MTVLTEIFTNISYAILVAFTTILFIALADLTFNLKAGLLYGWIKALGWCGGNPSCTLSTHVGAIDLIIIALAANFVETIFMVLIRVHRLLSKEFASEA